MENRKILRAFIESKLDLDDS